MTDIKCLPESVEAERFVLASVMMTAEVMHAARPLLEVRDFSLERHRRIWRRACELYDAGKPVDALTLYTALTDHKEREHDSLSYLRSLDDGVPQLANIDAWMQTVKDKSALRQVMLAADHMFKMAAAGEGTAQNILDGCMQALTAIGPKESNVGLRSAKEVVDAVGLSKLLQPRRERGLMFPWPWMNQVTGGMLPAELWILAAHTSVGKTSAMLQHGVKAAQRGKSVAIFSLEVSVESLFQKACFQLSCVDSERGKQGRLDGEERRRVNEAAAELYDLPLHFDTNSTTVPQIHAAVRRKRLKGPVDHVIVDYLQLLGNAANYGNRAQAVGANAWALKMLASDFKIPVLLLSQFSRTTKDAKPRSPELSDLKECVTGDTLLINADTGTPTPISEIAPGDRVLAMSKNQQIHPFTVNSVWSTGIKPVLKLRTRTGREIRLTDNHPMYTATGWVKLSALKVGDVIATGKSLERCDSVLQCADESLCRLMGYLVGDGSYLGYSVVSFISADKSVFEDASGIIRKMWPDLNHRIRPHPEGYFEAQFTRPVGKGLGVNGLRVWLRNLGVEGSRDSNKRVPGFVFRSGESGIANFLAGYFATDGCIKSSKQKPRTELQFDSTSNGLLRDVQLLLLRLGIVSTLSAGAWNTKSTKPIYRLTASILDANVRRFAMKIPVVGRKGQLLADLLKRPAKQQTNGGLFSLPGEISELMWERSGNKQKGGGWTHQGKRPSRESAKAWAEKYNDSEVEMWANSDLLWEEVVSIEPCGKEEVFDICIPNAENFVGNGIVLHNSGDIENHANGVWFIHRENMADADQVSVQFMLPKQRDGRRNIYSEMWFHPQYQRFDEKGTE